MFLKKKYIKPEQNQQHYELSNTNAACAFDVTLSDNSSCTATGSSAEGMGGVVLFLNKEMGCLHDPKIFEFYCYQNGSSDDGANVFNS